MVTDRIQELEGHANDLRALVIQAVHTAGSGHIGGALSAADMVAVLYFSELSVDPRRPDWPDRDRFVLSKGHACPIVYAALARRGFFPVEELWTLRKLGSRLQGHPDMRATPGIDATTGSLGQGISIACGLALAAKITRRPFRVYAMIGCGESQEGQVWEAAMAGAHYGLDNFVVIVDYNGVQLDGRNREIMEIAPLADKWRAFGWHTLEIDGHKVSDILDALSIARQTKARPTAIIARTVKGRGVSFMEDRVEWHSGPPSEAQLGQALGELARAGDSHG
jgi:transketolase